MGWWVRGAREEGDQCLSAGGGCVMVGCSSQVFWIEVIIVISIKVGQV